MRPTVVQSAVYLTLLLLILLSSSAVLGQQQGQWGQWRPPRAPAAQFSPLPLVFQNSQSSLPKGIPGQKLPKTTDSMSSTRPFLGGKVHLLSTLWSGMRNSGLERSIAGDILERVLKISLRDIVVPFKRDVILPLMS